MPTNGLSYNPTFEDHQNVLKEAIELEDELREHKYILNNNY